jgi:hypothetical protein
MPRPGLLVRYAPLIALSIFPRHAPAQTPSPPVADGPGIVVEPGAKVLQRPPVFFPSGATANGSVTVRSTVGAKGDVIDARVVRGPEQLRRAVERPQLAIPGAGRPLGRQPNRWLRVRQLYARGNRMVRASSLGQRGNVE